MRNLGIILVLVVGALISARCTHWKCGYSTHHYPGHGPQMQRNDSESPYPSYNYPSYSHTGGSPANDFYPGPYSKGYSQGYMNRAQQIAMPLPQANQRES